MVLNPIATILKPFQPVSSTVLKIGDDMIDKLYNVNQERYKKYKKSTSKYLTMNATINPHINSQDNTTYYVKNESDCVKYSENLYKNNTTKINKK
jgi:hypothetical protein